MKWWFLVLFLFFGIHSLRVSEGDFIIFLYTFVPLLLGATIILVIISFFKEEGKEKVTRVSEWILESREFWLYYKLKQKFKDKEISKLDITITNQHFTYSKKKNDLEFNGETIRFPNNFYMFFWFVKNLFKKDEGVKFHRDDAGRMDMLFVGPGIPGEESYVYHLKIE